MISFTFNLSTDVSERAIQEITEICTHFTGSVFAFENEGRTLKGLKLYSIYCATANL